MSGRLLVDPLPARCLREDALVPASRLSLYRKPMRAAAAAGIAATVLGAFLVAAWATTGVTGMVRRAKPPAPFPSEGVSAG